VRSATINRRNFRPILAGLLLSLTSCGSATDRTLEDRFEQSYTIEPTADVSIRNRDGVVRVYGSRANELRVQAIKRAYTPGRLKQIVIDVSVQPGSVSIETNFPPNPTWGLFDRSGTVEYTIVVPQSANISRLELGNGDVLVAGMRGQTVHAQLERGLMIAHDCFSNGVFSLGRGTLTLAYHWWEPGKFSIQANVADGNVLAVLPSAAAFHLIAETPHGKIANDFTAKDRPDGGVIRKIDTVIGLAPAADLSVRAAQGNIRISKTYP
jgi:hypothetical protein